jgi:hypothetical protein
MAREEGHPLPGQIVALSGLRKRGVGEITRGHTSNLVEFVRKMTSLDDEVIECRCIPQYRNVLDTAIRYHIAHMEADPEDRQSGIARGGEILADSMGRLNVCLMKCRRK